MFKLLLLLICIAVAAGAGYWYGYGLGQKDASAATRSHSLEAQTRQYVDRLRSIEVQYRDKDGNIVIPKVKWDELNRDARGGDAR